MLKASMQKATLFFFFSKTFYNMITVQPLVWSVENTFMSWHFSALEDIIVWGLIYKTVFIIS